MISVGIRELKQHTSEILRKVREDGKEIQVTYHGKTIALLVPVKPVEPVMDEEENTAWTNLDQLAAEISIYWQEGLSASEAVYEARREL